jgi:hypothetical protein
MLTRAGKPRRPRRIGGKDASWQERAPVVLKMRATPGAVETWNWRSQCCCGSIQAKFYRRAWWCWHCGREKDPAKRPPENAVNACSRHCEPAVTIRPLDK